MKVSDDSLSDVISVCNCFSKERRTIAMYVQSRISKVSIVAMLSLFVMAIIAPACMGAGLFGRSVSRQRIVNQPARVNVQRVRVQQFRTQPFLLVPQQSIITQQFAVPQALVVPQQLIVPQQQVVVPFVHQPSQAIIIR